MTYQPLPIDKVFDLTQFQPNDEGLKAAIARLEVITGPMHDASEHKFEDDPDMPGVCKHCGLVHPNVPSTCCGISLRGHLLEVLQRAKDIRDGKNMPKPPDIQELLLFASLLDAFSSLLDLPDVSGTQDVKVRVVLKSKHSPRRRGLFG